MAVSYEEAMAMVTGPGSPLETGPREFGGVTYRAFLTTPRSMRDIFDTARTKDGTFIVYEDERWSFADHVAQVDALAYALVHEYGVQKGDRVAIAMRNLPEWVQAFAAILSIGAVSVSFNAWWTEDEFDYAISDSGSKVLIVDPERVERSVAGATAHGARVLVARAGADALPEGFDRWSDVVHVGNAMPEVEIDGEDYATILYTSGTTGRPKGAVSTHRAVVQAMLSFAANAGIQSIRRGADVIGGSNPPCFILIVPLFHVTGCVPVMMTCYIMGLKLVMMYKWDPEAALKLIQAEKVTNFVGVPTQSWDLLESPTFADYDTSTLVSIGGGGAPAPSKLVDRVENTFANGRPNIGYGMTETNAYGPGNYGDDYVSHPTSTGRATMPVMDTEIRDDDGNAVPAGVRGEIWMKGPNLISGYWNRPDATAETIVDGWLRSGDIGRVDEEGFLYIEDRAKDMVLRGGENVYSAEVESAIYEHPAIYEAAVFGIPHERLGEEVAAVIVLRDGETATEEELAAFVRERLAAFKVPSRILVTYERLPRSAQGKVLKRQLRETAFAD